ncbi:MAG: ABC transporter substrate-binding protein, partial [Chloroflexota bacterium]
WEVSPDASLFTFRLVKNARFHDGKPVTSADVKMSLEGILKYSGPAAAVMQHIGSIETPDAYTLKIVMSKPNAALLYSLSVYPWTPILPKHLYDGTDWMTNPYNLKPVGSGPFAFSELVHGDHVILTRNDKYFGRKALLDRVGAQFVPDAQTALQALQAGQYGALGNPPDLGLISQLRASPNLQVEAPPGPWLCYMGINTTKGPLSKNVVRQALALGINRADVAQKVTAGVARPAANPYVSGIRWAWDPDVKYPAYNPQKASQMLDAAGYHRNGSGTRFTLNLLCDTVEGFYPNVANVLKAQLSNIGVGVNIELVDDATFLAAAPKLKHDLIIYALWIGPDPDQWNELLKTANAATGTGFRNWFGYSNPQVDQLFDHAVEYSARSTRKKDYYKIQQIVARDLPYIGLFEAPYSFAHLKSYQGFFS